LAVGARGVGSCVQRERTASLPSKTLSCPLRCSDAQELIRCVSPFNGNGISLSLSTLLLTTVSVRPCISSFSGFRYLSIISRPHKDYQQGQAIMHVFSRIIVIWRSLDGRPERRVDKGKRGSAKDSWASRRLAICRRANRSALPRSRKFERSGGRCGRRDPNHGGSIAGGRCGTG
jgi:hypothetical protein